MNIDFHTMLHWILISFLGFLSIPVFLFFMQVVFACIRKSISPKSLEYNVITKPETAVLIPAHNEAVNISETIKALLSQVSSNKNIIVIADNCTDDTAQHARDLGVTVIERFNNEDKGKGYALDYGVNFLSKMETPDVLMIVDADCIVAKDFVEKVSKACITYKRPIQSDYLMTFPEPKALKEKVAELAWIVKNKVRPLGYSIIGLPCQLMGTGMAFIWGDIKQCNLANGNLVEDMQLGLELAEAGKPPYYLSDTYVTSVFPSSAEGISTQRRRWEHGHINVILKNSPKLLKAFFKCNVRFFMMLLDLCIPPLALLMILLLSAIFITGVANVAYGYTNTYYYASTLLIIFLLTIFVAWLSYGRETIKLRELVLAPLVLLKKLPLYVGFIFNRQTDWVRSKRD